MNQPLVNLRVDFAFKQLFGTRGNEQILMQFLNVTLASSLSSPIQSLTIEDPVLVQIQLGMKKRKRFLGEWNFMLLNQRLH